MTRLWKVPISVNKHKLYASQNCLKNVPRHQIGGGLHPREEELVNLHKEEHPREGFGEVAGVPAVEYAAEKRGVHPR